ncbi:MAG: multisubunit Na+/H+ antiporter MnhF subunit [Arcticibacterium sp.]|jgi:multisubunit Na+/H+ antiporter MnhF subunit
MAANKEILNSYLSIRKLIGTLGLMLPIILIALEKEYLSSISHYYYTKTSVFFIAILFSFGILLISYRGYEKDEKTEYFSDNFITKVGGFAILLVVFFPTKCIGSNSPEIAAMCDTGIYPLYGHMDKWKSIIHFASAGIFLFTMGWMSIFRFTKGPKTPDKIIQHRIYKICGYIIWACIAVLGVEFLIQLFNEGFQITKIDVFIMETVAIFAFGISWLVKGEAMKDIEEIGTKIKEMTNSPDKE